jgi:hypothetical protein
MQIPTIREGLIWMIIIIIFCVIVYNTINEINPYCELKYEHMINVPELNNDKPKWTRTDSCKFYMNDSTYKVLDGCNAQKTVNHEEADLYFPCGYNNINNEIESLPNVYNKNIIDPKRVFIIDGADEITAKNFLWKNLYNHHGLTRAKQLAPNTYLLYNPQKKIDLIRMEKEHYPGKLYIMKKNIQRQTGLEITNDIEKIKKNSDNYIVVQELIQDSYFVNKRKINLRIYMVVLCHKSNIDVFMFNNGFMYYTKQDFVKDDINPDNHITTGYVDRDVYIKNPLTHDDFKRFLDLDEGVKYHKTSNQSRILCSLEKTIRKQGFRLYDIVFKRIENLMTDVFITFKGNICKKVDTNNNTVPIYTDYSVQIFGADVAINDQLQPQIIEINKGPDLSLKDDRDGTVKKQLIHDTMEIIGIIPKTEKNGLIKILEM